MRRLIEQAWGLKVAHAQYTLVSSCLKESSVRKRFPNPGVSQTILPAMADGADEDNSLAKETLRAVVRTVLEELQAST